jgi:hypothetical protein
MNLQPSLAPTQLHRVPVANDEPHGTSALLIPAPRRGSVLRALFDATSPRSCGGDPSRRRLWQNEAAHRALTLCQLVLKLEQRDWRDGRDDPDHHRELELARRLAEGFRALDLEDEVTPLPCADLLHDVLSSLTELFRPVVGEVSLTSDCREMTLPAFKRRALVLAAVEFIARRLLQGFEGCAAGRFAASLVADGRRHGTLLVEDDGNRLLLDGVGHDIDAALAALLGAEIVYRRSAALGGGAVELRFPLR